MVTKIGRHILKENKTQRRLSRETFIFCRAKKVLRTRRRRTECNNLLHVSEQDFSDGSADPCSRS